MPECQLALQVFKRVGRSAIRLLLVPGICEAFFDGGIAIPIFGMPPLFAFALGFILKAVGPALVIQCMFEVQQKRLGTLKCAPPPRQAIRLCHHARRALLHASVITHAT